jgi:hypothetical protein
MNTPTKINWQVGEQFDDAGDGYTTMHYATGVSDDGREWQATAIKVFGDVEEIIEIEEA